MTAEYDKCRQISHKDAADGEPISHEYLLNVGDRIFTVEVIGVPPHPDLGDISKQVIPPFAVPVEMLHDPTAVCKFILSVPFNSLRHHLVQQKNLPKAEE